MMIVMVIMGKIVFKIIIVMMIKVTLMVMAEGKPRLCR